MSVCHSSVSCCSFSPVLFLLGFFKCSYAECRPRLLFCDFFENCAWKTLVFIWFCCLFVHLFIPSAFSSVTSFSLIFCFVFCFVSFLFCFLFTVFTSAVLSLHVFLLFLLPTWTLKSKNDPTAFLSSFSFSFFSF